MVPKLPDSDWSRRHQPISFARLIALRSAGKDSSGNDIFESLSSGYPPTAVNRTYGGHVYAQAAYAASKTVAKGMWIHNCTCHFLLLGDTAIPFRYVVKRVRDGGVYCLRTVDVFQESKAAEGGKTPCFVMTVSFKRDEEWKKKASAKGQRQHFRHQDVSKSHIDDVYGSVLEGKRFRGS